MTLVNIRGCYVHTASVSIGNGVNRHICWINEDPPEITPLLETCPNRVHKFGERQQGFCVTGNNRDQNSGVYKLQGGDFFTEEAHQTCLEMCACFPGATGCEMIWDQYNRGCYVHTGEVARGNGRNRHSCYIGPSEGVCSGPR